MARKQKRPTESIEGFFGGIPHSVLDSVAFMGASYPAKALMLELIRQHTGANNGHLHLAHGWLEKRGWTSRSVIGRAKKELIDRGLMIRTRQGGLNMGADKYAVTWLSISNFVGLDIQSKDYHKGAHSFMNELPPPKISKGVPLEGTGSTFSRASTVPFAGTVVCATVP
jgi:hypothetical protein